MQINHYFSKNLFHPRFLKKVTGLFMIAAFFFTANNIFATTYIRGGFISGLYKMHGNEKTDGHHPTKTMHGFTAAVGILLPVQEDGFVLRLESAYVFGYRYPSTDYSALMVRAGFEYDTEGSPIIPYILIGGGVIALDPEDAFVQVGPIFDVSSGVRIPIQSGFSIDVGAMFSRGFLKYSEKRHPSKIDRIVGMVGIQKIF